MIAFNAAGRAEPALSPFLVPPELPPGGLPDNDDNPSTEAGLGFFANFFGRVYNSVFVNNNGNVTFGSPLVDWTPDARLRDMAIPIIGPFFGDADTREGGGSVSYRQELFEENSSLLIEWVGVDYYNVFEDDEGVDLFDNYVHQSKFNTYRLRLVNRSDINPGDFDIHFDYGALNWDTGDASGGFDGFDDPLGRYGTGYPARAGYSNGTGEEGTYHELQGSGQDRGLLGLANSEHVLEIRNATVDLQIDGVPESGTGARRGWLPLNGGIEENNRDAAGGPLPDYEPDASAGHRITSNDPELLQTTLAVGGNVRPGTWSLKFPSHVRIWRQEGSSWVEVTSEQPSPEITSATTVQLRIEGISSGATLDDAEIVASFTPRGADTPAQDKAWLTVGGVDVDIDSDESPGSGGQFAGPDRTPEEEGREDAPGQDQYPGKVILINDGDADDDGIQDYVDGFDWDGVPSADDQSVAVRFVPIVIYADSIVSSDGKIRIAYDASDPADETVSDVAPHLQPAAGALRLWLRDGDQARDKRGVSSGGDYVPPGDYSLGDLGLQPGQPLMLFVEAIRASASVGQWTVEASIDPTGSAGFLMTDRVRLTASRIEVLGRGYNESEFSTTHNLITSDLSEAPIYGYTHGAFMVHKVRVYDPRQTGISELTFDGIQSLSLVATGGFYETPEFMVVAPASPVNWSQPYQRVALDAPEVDLEYNPARKLKNPRLRDLNAAVIPPSVKELQDQTEQIGDRLKADLEANGKKSWIRNYNVLDSGKYGKQLDKDLKAWTRSLKPEERARWLTDVYVDVNTKKIVGMGDNMPNAIKNDPKVQQIDLVKMKENQTFAKGDDWNLDNVEAVHEVKTSSQNRFQGRQRSRYLALTNDGEKLHVHFTQHTFEQTASGGKMIINKQYSARNKVLSAIGFGGTALVGTIWGRSLGHHDVLMRKTEHAVGWAAKMARQAQNGSIDPNDQATYAHVVAGWHTTVNDYMESLLPAGVDFDGSHLAGAAILLSIYLADPGAP